MPDQDSVSADGNGAVVTSNAEVDRLVPIFDGTGDVVEWYTCAEIICTQRGVDFAKVLPSRLRSHAFYTWFHLSAEEKIDPKVVKQTLYDAFGINMYTAYSRFASRRMQPGESPDTFLTALKMLADAMGGVPEKLLKCAFVTGLPGDMSQAVENSTDSGNTLQVLLARARGIYQRSQASEAVCAVATKQRTRTEVIGQRVQRCFNCGQPGHMARHCQHANTVCFKCGQEGHMARGCAAGNGRGAGVSAAPAPSLPAPVLPRQ